LLDKYRETDEVALVGGNNFGQHDCQHSYCFSRYAQIWGWAAWKRTWLGYDVGIRAWSGDPNSLKRSIQNARVRRYFAKRFDSVKSGEMDTWDYQLVHLCLSKGLVCITPRHNLVDNIGFDGRATHTVTAGPAHPLPAAEAMVFPLSHPPAIEVDERADRYNETHVRGIPANLFSSLFRSLKKRLRI
jgi:hypothetical protein